METTLRKDLLFLFFSFLLVRSRSDGTVLNQNSAATSRNAIPLQANDDKSNGTRNDVVVNNKGKNNGGGGGGGGGGGAGWGWGGGGGGGNRRGGWGWGSGGGGGIYWRWGCNGHGKRGRRSNRKRVFPKEDYKIGEFAQCMLKGRCKGMRLDCPLHCGGSCFYDCRFMCKPHCKRY